MPISHKIRQYRALLRFAHLGEILWSPERAEEVVPKQGIWRGFMHEILIGSPRAQAARMISPPILTAGTTTLALWGDY